jgi:hypothetical protein
MKNESADHNTERVVLMIVKAVPQNDGLLLKEVQTPYQAPFALNLQTFPIERSRSENIVSGL